MKEAILLATLSYLYININKPSIIVDCVYIIIIWFHCNIEKEAIVHANVM